MGMTLRPVKRPTGTFFVVAGRTGVQPSGGCAVGFPIWLVSRLRWQAGPRTWSVEAVAPLSRQRWNTRLRRLDRWDFDSRDAAEAFVPEVVRRLSDGEYDDA